MKKNNYIYPTHIDDCTLENWDACCGCYHWDKCDRKEQFREFNTGAWVLILFSAVLVNFLIAYLIGIL